MLAGSIGRSRPWVGTLRRPPQWDFWWWKFPCAFDFCFRRRFDLGRPGWLLPLLAGVVAGRLAPVPDIAILHRRLQHRIQTPGVTPGPTVPQRLTHCVP